MKKTAPASQPRRSRRHRTDHDFLWKAFLQFFLRAFILFVKPALYRAIDWSRPPEFLEQEMRNALRRYSKRKKFADLLVKVWLKSGEEKWILILLEVQSYFDSLFCERIFDYFVLLVNKYQMKDIAIFALYTGEQVPKLTDRFEHETFGTAIRLKFTAVQATKRKEDELVKSKNPVALAFLANIWRIRTKDKPPEREEKMLRLADMIRERKYPADKFYEICNFVRDILDLSSHSEKQFIMKASQIEKRRKPEPMLPPLLHRKKDRWFIDIIYKAYYGFSPSELEKTARINEQQVVQYELQLQQAQQQAQEVKEQAKQVKQQARQAERQAKLQAKLFKEQVGQQAKQAEQQAKRLLTKSILVLSKDLGWDAAKIAAHLEVEVAEVEKILGRRKKMSA